MEMESLEEEAKKRNMSKKKHARLHKSFRHFSKALKKLNGHGRPSANDNPSPASTSSFLSACMHPRTHSFSFPGGRQRHVDAHNRDNDDDALAAGFRSLRIGPTAVLDDDGDDGSSTQEDYDGVESEEGTSQAMAATKAVVAGSSGGVAVVTFSVAPYEDFRRSMREMADAHWARREAAAPAVDWDFMEELLFCYLQLNDRAVHKDILRAFTDTVAALRRRRRAPKPKSRRTRRRQPKGDDGGNVGDVEETVASS
nr:transcription repressor OFP14-like [Lolium perenne]